MRPVEFTSGPGSAAQPLATLGVLGDIHVEDERLETGIRWLQAQGTDRIVHVGDVCDGRGSLTRTLALLHEHRIEGIGGNHERWFLARAMRELRLAHPVEALTPSVEAALTALPSQRLLHTIEGPLLLCHGVGEDDMLVLRPDTPLGAIAGSPALQRLLAWDELRFVVAGHTHVHSVQQVGHLAWINAGTLKYDDAPVVTRIDLERREVGFAQLACPAQIGDVERRALPDRMS